MSENAVRGDSRSSESAARIIVEPPNGGDKDAVTFVVLRWQAIVKGKFELYDAVEKSDHVVARELA